MAKTNNKKTIFLNTVFVFSETVINKFAFFIINIIVSRYLKEVRFGEYATALGFATYFAMFSDIGINTTLVRMIIKDPEHERNHITNAFLIKTTLAVLSYIALCVSLFFIYYPTGQFDIIYLTLIFGVVRIGNDYMSTFYAIFTAHDKFRSSTIINSCFSILFLLSTALVVYFAGNYYHIALSRMLIVIAFTTGFIIYVTKKYVFSFSFIKFKEFLHFAFFFGLGNVIQNSLYRLNVMLVPVITAPIYGGFFSNAFIFYSSIIFVPGGLGRVLISYLYKHKEDKNKYQFVYDIYSKILVVLSFYIAIITFFYAEEIIQLIYGSKFLPSALPLKIIALAIPSLFIISDSILTGMDKQKERTQILIKALIANVILNAVLIKFFSMTGAAVAVIGTQVFLSLSYTWYLKKNKIIEFKKHYTNVIKMILIAGVCAAVNYNFTNKLNPILGGISISAVYFILVMFLVFEKKDMKIIKNIIGKQ
ncbi:MAG TPA: flippase [Spirochaetota bacterium]|nr:flippase [Spirochaetota bacterium]HOR45584.1 flippase [Spirochaetota bacterium]